MVFSYFRSRSANSPSTQPAQPTTPVVASIPLFSTTVGATVDSFYRSGMNALLNSRLTNQKAALFPNMHM
jgi:hypothetical protein